jgi:hypothetical protein
MNLNFRTYLVPLWRGFEHYNRSPGNVRSEGKETQCLGVKRSYPVHGGYIYIYNTNTNTNATLLQKVRNIFRFKYNFDK